MPTILELLCLFILTWFSAGLPPPFRIVLFVLEGIALVLIVAPLAPLRPLF